MLCSLAPPSSPELRPAHRTQLSHSCTLPASFATTAITTALAATSISAAVTAPTIAAPLVAATLTATRTAPSIS